MENPIKYPEIGVKVKCRVMRSSFTHAILKIVEVAGSKTFVGYKAILKGNDVGEGIFVCDTIKKDDEIDCFVVSFGDNAIFVSQC